MSASLESIGGAVLPRAPAPWRLAGDAHVLLARTGAAPPGVHRAGVAGRLGALAFIRYTASNVGPYDELLWLAAWGLYARGRRWHTVTRIYVSSEASRAGGWDNWAIPKQLAEFVVEPTGIGAQRVRVSCREGTVASFQVMTGERSLPFDSALLPARWRELGQRRDDRLWCAVPTLKGRLHPARFSELRSEAARFVDMRPQRLLPAFSLLGFEMLLPAARVLPLE